MSNSLMYKFVYLRPARQMDGTYSISYDEYWTDCPEIDPFFKIFRSLNKVPCTHFPYDTCGIIPPIGGPFKHKIICYPVQSGVIQPHAEFWIEEDALDAQSLQQLFSLNYYGGPDKSDPVEFPHFQYYQVAEQ